MNVLKTLFIFLCGLGFHQMKPDYVFATRVGENGTHLYTEIRYIGHRCLRCPCKRLVKVRNQCTTDVAVREMNAWLREPKQKARTGNLRVIK